MMGNPSSGGAGEASLIKIMDKKTYIAPEMEVMNIETVEMIATSLGVFDTNVNSKDQLATGSRDWDDLW